MIKKISQLDRLRERHSLENLSGDKVLFEVSYKTNDDQLNQKSADEINYYTSYAINETDLESIVGLSSIKETLSAILSDGISVITGDLDVGTPGSPTNDRLTGDHQYHPDKDHYLNVYSTTNFEGSNNEFHGTTDFHNNVTISCNDVSINSNKNPILHVTGVATFDQTINGTAFRAKWADLAEVYSADKEYEPGTLVKFGGNNEITIATDKANAVITSKPSIVLNDADKKTMSFPTEIALVGKVPVKVLGPVKKFDNIVLSKLHPGVGVIYNFSLPYEIIGKALEDNFKTEEKLVLCVVNLNLR